MKTRAANTVESGRLQMLSDALTNAANAFLDKHGAGTNQELLIACAAVLYEQMAPTAKELSSPEEAGEFFATLLAQIGMHWSQWAKDEGIELAGSHRLRRVATCGAFLLRCKP